MDPFRTLLLGSFFLMREMELAAALLEHVTLLSDPLRVSWLLPVSKTDQCALGKTRVWGCTCGGGFEHTVPVPCSRLAP